MSFPLIACGLLLTACEKVETPEPIGTGGQKIFTIQEYGGTTGANYGNSALIFPDPTSTSEVVEFQVEYSTPVVATNDINITIDVDAAAIAKYNAANPTGPQYILLPTNAYTITTAQGKIPANQIISEPFAVTFNPSVIDVTKNYMLPITIKSAAGAPADAKPASGTGTAYFHLIGNPLAGLYTVTGTRYNYTGSVTWTGPPAAFPAGGTPSAIPTTKLAVPVDGQTVSLEFAALSGLGYYYLVTGNATFSNITIDYSTDLLNASSARKTYITNYVAPSPTQKASFHVYTHYNNVAGGGGNDRIIDEIFVQQ
ncbi:MAG: DUF1735 domain-containing protein [Bacteroidota bacterium]